MIKKPNLDKILSLPMQEKILILDFGSQFTQLIARRVRELNIYCEIHPFNNYPEIDSTVKGIILSGSPYSVRQEDAPHFDFDKFHTPPYFRRLLWCAICSPFSRRRGIGIKHPRIWPCQFGLLKRKSLFKDVPVSSQVWMSHGDTIARIADNFEVIASTDSVKVAAYQVTGTQTYGIQFHPEVTHSIDGKQLLQNFLVDICGCKQDWTPDSFIETTIAALKEKLGDDKVVLGLSGGVDSSVAAVLLHQAIGKNLHCIFVDNGLLRKDEYEQCLIRTNTWA
jgi:GMP synthase (glutamine-hydrolysing)